MTEELHNGNHNLGNDRGLVEICKGRYGLRRIGLDRAVWICIAIPSPGISIGILGGVAAFMSLRGEMKIWERTAWIVIVSAFVTVEVISIHRSDRENLRAKKEQACRLQALNLKSEELIKGLQVSIEDNQKQFKTTLDGIRSVDKETHQVANQATETLKDITGGDSFAYLDVRLARSSNQPDQTYSIVKKGTSPLYEVKASIMNFREDIPGLHDARDLDLGTLGAGDVPVTRIDSIA
jgi:hypothetical protein